MSYCRVCGNELEENVNRCSECGEFQNDVRRESDDKGSILHVLIGLFLPVIGFILFLVWMSSRPKSARNALIGSLISLPFIVIMGVMAAFIIPAVGAIVDNTQQSAVYADALTIEQAADLYCADTLCENGDEFTLYDLQDYMIGFNQDYYDISMSTVIAIRDNGDARVYLEAAGEGGWEFIHGEVPSLTTRDDSVFIDTD